MSNWYETIIGWSNGLVPNKWENIIEPITNFWQRIYASLDPNELKNSMFIAPNVTKKSKDVLCWDVCD